MTVRLAAPDGAAQPPDLDLARLQRDADALLDALGHARSEVSLSLVDDAAMAELNERWRGRAGPTDVLSFSLLEGEGAEHRGELLGDVVIDVQVAERQARELGHGLREELLRLLIHGTLHLLGYDHEEPGDAARMEAFERELWQQLER